MELSSGEVIPELKSEKGYKQFSVLVANDIMHTEIKDKIKKEYYRYYRRVTQLASSKIKGGNKIRTINVRALSLVRYTGNMLEC